MPLGFVRGVTGTSMPASVASVPPATVPRHGAWARLLSQKPALAGGSEQRWRPQAPCGPGRAGGSSKPADALLETTRARAGKSHVLTTRPPPATVTNQTPHLPPAAPCPGVPACRLLLQRLPLRTAGFLKPPNRPISPARSRPPAPPPAPRRLPVASALHPASVSTSSAAMLTPLSRLSLTPRVLARHGPGPRGLPRPPPASQEAQEA